MKTALTLQFMAQEEIRLLDINDPLWIYAG
jgi:hypothetical protein